MFNTNKCGNAEGSKQPRVTKKTTDYSLFKIQNGNRVINLSHKERLVKSILANDLTHVTPILCNEKMEIIDGQHRFHACQTLGRPIFYTVEPGLTLEDTQSLQLAKDWNGDNYLMCYVNLGYEDYIRYKEFKETFKLEHNLCQVLLTNGVTMSGTLTTLFNSGEFKIGDMAQAINEAELLEQILGVLPFNNKWSGKREAFYAIVGFIRHPKYDHERFLTKIVNNQSLIRGTQNQRKEFLRRLCEVYNSNARSVQKAGNIYYADFDK